MQRGAKYILLYMGKVRKWSVDEDLQLAELYKHNTALEVAEKMGLTVAQIRTRVQILHLRKEARYPEAHLKYLREREGQLRRYREHRDERLVYMREYRRKEKEKQLI